MSAHHKTRTPNPWATILAWHAMHRPTKKNRNGHALRRALQKKCQRQQDQKLHIFALPEVSHAEKHTAQRHRRTPPPTPARKTRSSADVKQTTKRCSRKGRPCLHVGIRRGIHAVHPAVSATQPPRRVDHLTQASEKRTFALPSTNMPKWDTPRERESHL